MPTIVPLIPESDWLSIFLNIPAWDAPLVPTLVLAPHPDDETLGAGGLIARLRNRGIPVTVVAITDGENAYTETEGVSAIRVLEQTEALGRLGVPEAMIHRFHLPDREVSAHEDQLVNLLLPFVSTGTHIVAPWPRDFHPDHEAAGRAAARVAQTMGLALTCYLFWTWHRGTLDLLDGLSIVKLVLNGAELDKKLYALQAHVSQFEHPDGQPILSTDLIAPARRTFEVYIPC